MLRVMGFVGVGGNIAISTALAPSYFVHCIVNIKILSVYVIFLSYFECFPEAAISECED